MYLHQSRSWFFSIVAIVTLSVSGGYFYTSNYSTGSQMIQFTDLSDSDIDMMLAVKAEMSEAKFRSN
jgi:hypothetical protein